MDRQQQLIIQALMQGYRQGTTPGGINISSVPGKRMDEIAFPFVSNIGPTIQGLLGIPLSPNQIVKRDFTDLQGNRFDPAFIKKAHE